MAGRLNSSTYSFRCFSIVVALLGTAGDWPGFAGPNGDFSSPERGVVWPPKLLWKVETGEGYTGPAVVANRVFLFDRVKDMARIRALDAANGSQIWSVTYPTDYVDKYGFDGGPRTVPAVADGRVFALGPEGRLIAVAAADGRKLWEIDTKAKYGVIQNFFGAGSSPWVERDLVIVAVGGTAPGPEPEDFRDLKGDGSAIVAFDAKTGAENYRVGKELASYSSPLVATVGTRRMGLYLARGGLLAFDPLVGTELFHFPWRARAFDSANAANPVVAGDRVLVSECYGTGAALLQVRARGYDVLWADEPNARQRRLDAHWATPILVGGDIYACSGRHSSAAEVRCLELATGKIRWRERGLARTTLVRVDEKLLVFGEYGMLCLLRINPDKYDEIGRVDFGPAGIRLLKPECWAAPVVSNGKMFLRGQGSLACFELIPSQK